MKEKRKITRSNIRKKDWRKEHRGEWRQKSKRGIVNEKREQEKEAKAKRGDFPCSFLFKRIHTVSNNIKEERKSKRD